MGRKRKNRSKKKIYFLLVSIFIVVLILILAIFILKNYLYNKQLIYETQLLEDIENHYNEYVITNKKSEIYIKDNDEYKQIGFVGENVILKLEEEEISIDTKYFGITSMDSEYFIKYTDVEKSEVINDYDDRYKKYVVFNQNVVSDGINLYDDNRLVYSLDKSVSLPIYIKDIDGYYVEYCDRLFYVKKDEVSVVDSINTENKNTNGIAVLNYHFFYDDSSVEERNDCNQLICSSTRQFKEHLEYIKNNNIFTPTMEELEMYIDGKLQLPKSVVITIDDGWRMTLGIEMLEEYELNATMFLITGWFDDLGFTKNNKYVEFHSHGEDLHDVGVCPGGQGGAIKCLSEEHLVDDLKKSQEKLGGSTVFCYPFYEYNNHSISVLKKAGYTMAFAGTNSYGSNLVKAGSDKYRLPRFVVTRYTTVNNLKNYLG